MLPANEQIGILKKKPHCFEKSLKDSNVKDLTAISLKTFQINVGRWCNQACKHCHVNASPIRTEQMDRTTAEKCIEIIASLPQIECVDITGGAPEGNPHFQYLVEESKKLGKHVIDRCNLTILEEPGYEWLTDFLASQHVEVISSLPHYGQLRTDQQRGKGVYDKSIRALKKLNALGYGKDLPLHLVYNPVGLYLSASQDQLELEFKESLSSRHGIFFHSLYCLNNVPINRFLEALLRKDKYEDYLETIVNAFNPGTLQGLMCRHQISVGYQGYVYDCDFNQMLDMKAQPIGHIDDFNSEQWINRKIQTANHCYACTAGAGSSCGGDLV